MSPGEVGPAAAGGTGWDSQPQEWGDPRALRPRSPALLQGASLRGLRRARVAPGGAVAPAACVCLFYASDHRKPLFRPDMGRFCPY